MAKFIKAIDLWNPDNIEAVRNGTLVLQRGQYVRTGDNVLSRFVSVSKHGILNVATGHNSKAVEEKFKRMVKAEKRAKAMTRESKDYRLKPNKKETTIKADTHPHDMPLEALISAVLAFIGVLLVAIGVLNEWPNTTFIGSIDLLLLFAYWGSEVYTERMEQGV